MRSLLIKLGVFLLITGLTPSILCAQEIKSPKDFFGFQPGDDHKLFDYEQLISYLQLLEKNSEKIKLVEIGRSPNDKPMYVLLISSAENLGNLDALKEINRRLSLENDIPDIELNRLIAEGKTFVIATMSMHSNEVGPSQAVPLMAYELITSYEPEKIHWLNETVLMITPSHNPDGMNMIVEHYRKYLGTKYEKTSMPGVYHKYVGHDNNRDFITLTQSDNKAISKLFSHEWFPQVMVEKHQMGASGVRYFVPPPHDPIAENIDAGILNWMGIFGARMMQRMTADSLKGVTQRYLFDDYWPGHTETCIWKNTIGMLTEAASTYHATPVFIESQEIRVSGKGLSEYKKGINMPDPWSGGWWRLSDIIKYEISSLWGIMETAADNREQILRFRNSLTNKMVNLGKTVAPYYYILPAEQHDSGELNVLIELLIDHGVKVYQLTENISLNQWQFLKGDVVVPLAQPFRSFIKEVMEKQEFPLRHYTPGGEMIRPYDITSWSLPLHLGLDSYEIKTRNPELEASISEIKDVARIDLSQKDNHWGYAFSASNNESYKAAFKAISAGIPVYRLEKPLEIDGKMIPAGSFFIEKIGKLNAVVEDLTQKPFSLSKKPDMLLSPIKLPKIGLVETWFHDMDAGWTRYIFDQYGMNFQLIRPSELANGVPAGIQVLIFPSSAKTVLLEGKYGEENDYYNSNYPPEFTKGLGKEGLKKIMKWVNDGGLVISWGNSTDMFEGLHTIEISKTETEQFRLPYKNIGSELAKKGLYSPGTLMNIKLIENHPLSFGMPSHTKIFSRGTPVFTTSVPSFDMDRRIIGSYTKSNIVASGFAQKDELLEDKAVMIWLKKGKGQLVLYGFNPQFRSNTHGTYKLLFNALLLNNNN
ncbi:MAG: M14 family metallopeptidase [Bacteroidales bacterium]|nr:M14 family metallopeptidase [Bacteroidales bacterium]